MRGQPLSNPGVYGIRPEFHVMRKRGIGITMLSRYVGVSVGLASAILSGRTVPSRHFVERSAQFLGLPADQLFSPELLRQVVP
jgi:transcriptional regulator with XRE-family HTH domain